MRLFNYYISFQIAEYIINAKSLHLFKKVWHLKQIIKSTNNRLKC